MSNTSLIIGESGTGKSSSLRNLDCKETFIINVLDKPLPFKGYKKNYQRVSQDWLSGNYCASDDYDAIIRAIKFVDKKRMDIKTLIIDDFQYVMSNEFLTSKEKGYEKFTSIGKHAWEILHALTTCRADLDCFVLSHSDIDANGRSKIKTIGKMLDEKVTIEGMFTIVLHTMVREGNYLFLTQNDGTHIAKSPMGMFQDKYIENDLAFIKSQMNNYYNEDIAI